MIVSLIAAVAQNRVIGKDNDLVWDIPEDMKFFKDTTRHHCIVTGRRNYESIPAKFRPLKNRVNIVVSQQYSEFEAGVIVCKTIEEAIDYARQKGEAELFVIGGGKVYEYCIKNDLADKLYITWVHQDFEGDTHFPEIDEEKFKLVSTRKSQQEEPSTLAYSFCVYEKVDSL